MTLDSPIIPDGNKSAKIARYTRCRRKRAIHLDRSLNVWYKDQSKAAVDA
jgi:hypothetical protein